MGTQKNRLNETFFEHPNHMFKLMGKEINAIVGAQTIRIWNYNMKLFKVTLNNESIDCNVHDPW